MNQDDFIQDVARGAGQILRDRFRASNAWREKGHKGDIVTEVDERSESYVIERITREIPNARILSEEVGVVGPEDAELTWIIDPLDGTRNYAVGIPFFGVSIGLSRNGRSEAGVIYDPIHEEMFFARCGKGAFLNGEPMYVSGESSIEDGIVSVAWVKRKSDRTSFLDYISELSRDTSYFRRFGSAALAMAYVACGRVWGYLQSGLNPWDVAAGVVLIEEAGGVVSDFANRPVDLRNPDIEIVAANLSIHGMLMKDVIGKCSRS